MNGLHFRKMNVAAQICLGLALCTTPIIAAEPAVPTATVTAPRAARILDVELTAAGQLTGYVVNHQGQPLAEKIVSLRQQRREVARTTTDETGRFVLPALQCGTYQILAGEGHGLVRLWSKGMAPPAAKSQLVVVSDRQPVVRGQVAGISTAALMLGGAAVAGGATGAALLLNNDGPGTNNVPVQNLETITLDTIGTPVTGVIVDNVPVSP